MKLYVHLIYLLGLLCLLEVVIQPENIKYDTQKINHEWFNTLNVRRIDENNQKFLFAVEKASFNYPSPVSSHYKARSQNIIDCYEEARYHLHRLNAQDFWQFRTENYELFKEITDRNEYQMKNDWFVNEEKAITAAGKLIELDFPAVKNDYCARLAMAAQSAVLYCSTRTSYDGCGFDKFFPGLISDGFFTVTDKNISLSAVMTSFSSRDLKIYNSYLPPEKDGIITLDTTIQNPGSYQIPFRLYSRRAYGLELQYDTVNFEVFPD